MRTILTDIDLNSVHNFEIKSDDYIVNVCECKNNCVGCFNCWIKTPKKCIFNDNYNDISNYLLKSSELIIVSKLRYGCYSSEIKKVLERCIGYVMPHFMIRNNSIHHKLRTKNKLALSGYFYGSITHQDKKCIKKLLIANAINLNAKEDINVYFNKWKSKKGKK